MAETKIGRLLDVIESTWTNPETKVEVLQLKAILIVGNDEVICKVTSKAAFDKLTDEIGNYFQYISKPYEIYKGQPVYSHKIAFKVESPV